MSYLELYLVVHYRPRQEDLVLFPIQSSAVVPAPDRIDGAPRWNVVQEVQPPEVRGQRVDVDTGQAGGDQAEDCPDHD